jgi:hypothetical protein
MRLGTIIILCLLAAVTVSAQGRARGRAAGSRTLPAASQPYSSNAPAGTPHASADRDLGKDRAVDVGKGKHKGLTKAKKTPKKHTPDAQTGTPR